MHFWIVWVVLRVTGAVTYRLVLCSSPSAGPSSFEPYDHADSGKRAVGAAYRHPVQPALTSAAGVETVWTSIGADGRASTRVAVSSGC